MDTAHYDAEWNVNRWGSKYEQLILPVFTILFGYSMLLIVKRAGKIADTKANENALIVITSSSVLVFNVLCYVLLYKAYFTAVGEKEPIKLDLNQLIFMALGISLCLMGNIMPKCKRNSLAGLRTKWSMANDTTWFHSQRYGGIALMISGIVIVVANLFTTGMGSIVASLAVLVIDMIVSTIISYQVYKKYSDDSPDKKTIF